MSDDGKNTADEKSASNNKLESMPPEQLLKLTTNLLVQKRKFEAKIVDLTTANVSLCQTEETLQNELDDQKSKCKNLTTELDQYKVNESKLQHDLNITRESLDCFQSQNDTFKLSCKNLQEEITSLQNQLANLSLSSNSIKEDLTNRLTESQNTIENLLNEKQALENLESINKELHSEIEQLKSNFSAVDREKQLIEEELANHRQQIVDLQVQRSSNEQVSQDTDSVLRDFSKEYPDVSSLLQSIGIPDHTNEEFSDSQSLLHFCALLIDRCRVLQTLPGVDTQLASITRNDEYELCRLIIPREEHKGLDTFFECLFTSIGQPNNSDQWELNLFKPIDQNTTEDTRLELNDVKFVSEHQLNSQRARLDQLLKENEEQEQQITSLRESQRSNEQLKEQLAEQHEKINELQSVIGQETINKTKFNELEASYEELQENYRQAQQIQSEYDLLKENSQAIELQLKEQQETHEKIKVDYEHQRFHLLEREETIRLLKLEIEQNKQSLESTNDKDEQCSSLAKQIQQLSDLLETKINENKLLIETNLHFQNDLKENNQLFFEKSKQADDLDRQLQIRIKEYEQLTTKSQQIENQRNQVNEQMERNAEQIRSFQKDKSEDSQIIDELRHDLEKSKSNFEELLQNNRDNTQIKDEFQKVIENLKQELVELKTRLSKSAEEQQSNLAHEKNQIGELQSDLEKSREEHQKLTETINELNEKLTKQINESETNIQDLSEKNQKLKILLGRMRKELQEKNQQPKQSLMDLELADYEKTIKSSKEELTQREKDIQDLQEQITMLNEKNVIFKQEMENVEQQKLQTEERADKLKTLLDTTRKELQDLKDLEEERHQNHDNVRTILEKLQIELDDNKVIVSQLLAEKQQLTDRLNNQIETTQRTSNLSEQNLRILKHDLDVAKQDYETLQDDFNNYKIRAQSVLKQHQSTQRERVPSSPDQQTDLEETLEKFKTSLQEANTKIQLLKSENEAFQKEQDRLTELQAKLVQESRKREQDLRKQHQVELDKLENDYVKRTDDSHDMMKNVTLQNETLSTTFKEQVAAIEADHNRSISLLQNQLQASRQEVEQLKIRIDSLRQANVDNEKDVLPSAATNEFSRDDLLWNYTERQQGEGSESASTDHQTGDVAAKTLENVLFGNQSSFRSTQFNSEKPRHILFEDVELERQRIEEELNKTKYRLFNTTELLNESELNNVRLSEQVSLLKDEIRRIERNMDRAESISNLEYLKNIVLKFLVLQSTDERLQLIPVLVTMLKLSPEEQAQLVRIAQHTNSSESSSFANESNTQQGAIHPASTASWSSYLGMW